MNRKEPYIGMPIHLDDFDDMDDMAVTCCGKTEEKPPRPEPRREPERNPASEQGNMGPHGPHGNMQPMALAMAYVPWQRWNETYPLDEGLTKGTIFPDLYLPFEGRRKGGMRR